MAAGIIRENNGPWSAPVTLTVKKRGKYRFCVVYMGLNFVTERESWPLPNIEEVLDNLAGHQFYTTSDGFSGFNTIPIRKEDQHLTTFRVPFGTYCCIVIPFGWKNAPLPRIAGTCLLCVRASLGKFSKHIWMMWQFQQKF